MRVLFCSHPAIGHFLQLVQLAWAFRSDGHDVLVAIADYAETAADSGLEVVDVAPDFDFASLEQQVFRDHPEIREALRRPVTSMDGVAPGLAGISRAYMDRTIALVDDWRPDLVVYDQPTTAGLYAAARRGVPAVQRNVANIPTKRSHDRIAGYLGDVADRYGITISDPDVIIELFPPSMLDEPEGWFMRWVSYSGGGVLGDRLLEPPSRPRVAVTLGTVELRAFGVDSLAPLVAAAEGMDAEFVLALGDVDLTPLGPLPPNVRAVGWTPLYALLRTCSAVVHHGGSATTLTALEVGIPQLVARNAQDPFQYMPARAIQDSGIGLVIDREKIDADQLTWLIDDPGLAGRIAAVREEMLALPTPRAIVDRIVRLVS